jgi:hypothetical protein
MCPFDAELAFEVVRKMILLQSILRLILVNFQLLQRVIKAPNQIKQGVALC